MQSEISFGISFGQAPDGLPPIETILEFAEGAEALGVDSLWMGDHIVTHVPVLDPISVLSALAARTRRIHLGLGVLLLPLRPPATIAKSIATLDYISNGRVIFGVGLGGENHKEFDLCGVPVNERGARANEGIVMLRELWQGDEVTHEGRFWRFTGVRMEPKPVQPGGPPIWIGGRSEAALKRAAALGDGWMGMMFTPDRFAACSGRIRALGAQAGRDLSRFTMSMSFYISIDDVYEKARRRAVEYISRMHNQPFDELVDRYCLVGSVEQCAQRVAQYVRAGAQNIRLWPTVGQFELLRHMETIARELIPLARVLVR